MSQIELNNQSNTHPVYPPPQNTSTTAVVSSKPPQPSSQPTPVPQPIQQVGYAQPPPQGYGQPYMAPPPPGVMAQPYYGQPMTPSSNAKHIQPIFVNLPPGQPVPQVIYVESPKKFVTEEKKQADVNSAAVILIIGFCFPIIWALGFFYMRSRAKAARVMSIISLVLFFSGIIGILVAIPFIVFSIQYASKSTSSF